MSKLKTAAIWQKAAKKTSEIPGFESQCKDRMLKHRTSFSTLAQTVVDNKRAVQRDKELKAKTAELEEVKGQLKKENEEKKQLQLQLQELTSNQTEANQKLRHFADTNEKLRLELKRKSEAIDKLEKHIAASDDRIRNLEIKASEVEKAEITLESTKKLLETSQGDCRGKDSELRRMKLKNDDTERELKAATKKSKDLELTIDDLKKQVRQELMTNESIERGLQSIPILREQLAEQEEKIGELEKELTEKTALLVASKQAVREYKDKIRVNNDKLTETEQLKTDLTLAQHEIETLKTLMKGKDTVMIQKLQTLEQAKKIINSPKSEVQYEEVNDLRSSIDKLSKLIRSDPSFGLNRRTMPLRSQSACHKSTFMTIGLVDQIDKRQTIEDDRNSRPVTAIVYPIRPNTVAGTHKNRKYITTDFDIFNENKQSEVVHNECDSLSNDSFLDSFLSHRRQSDDEIFNNLSSKQREEILDNIINIGDRVKIIAPQKQPRYGRKKVNPLNYCGIVKYKGYIGKQSHDAPLMIGVRLDLPNGDTEGVVNGTNYMFTPVNQGKFFKIRDVTSVFDRYSGNYRGTEKLMLQYNNQQSTDKHHNSDSN
ncbi:hypothetical protein LOTGIDRAFT_155792 [Lottia gigantea]|uniref:CAP-Gly domain-containing protein n=1 Tax=Lottia gigantea TaxID=225164 RepID=V3ZPJ3_LOTGI|nr:hypothetical protein LOTGIDRAFT_155792 [Lottia gigantea]ESO82771.1 hypothetical protein LOTGIDRAFT_155792 [Lottia gigantea]